MSTVELMHQIEDAFAAAKAAKAPRRRAVLFVTQEALFHVLLGLKGGKLTLPVFEGLPDDAEIRGVHYDWERGGFAVMLEHPSFQVVPDGCPAPRLEAKATEFRTVATVVESTQPDAVVG